MMTTQTASTPRCFWLRSSLTSILASNRIEYRCYFIGQQCGDAQPASIVRQFQSTCPQPCPLLP